MHARSVIICCQAFALFFFFLQLPYQLLSNSKGTGLRCLFTWFSPRFFVLVPYNVGLCFLTWRSTPIFFFLIVIFMRPLGLTESGSHDEVTLPVQAVPLIPWCCSMPFFTWFFSRIIISGSFPLNDFAVTKLLLKHILKKYHITYHFYL